MTNIIDIKLKQQKIDNPEAELAVIGSLIKDNSALTDVSNILKDGRMDFYDNKVRVIYDAIF